MIGGGARQRTQTLRRFNPWLPETVTIRKTIQTTTVIESRLLQRLVEIMAGHATRLAQAAIAVTGAPRTAVTLNR